MEGIEDEGPLSQGELPHIEDVQLSAEERVYVESSGPLENEAVYKLTEGLLSHYLPGLQNSKRTLQELTWPRCTSRKELHGHTEI